MEKDFDSWNIRKKTLDTKGTLRQVHEGEIWWASLGLNIGSEQDGKNNLFERPVLIIKRYNENMALILPLSSKNKISKYHYKVHVAHWQATVLLAQPRLISTKENNTKDYSFAKK